MYKFESYKSNPYRHRICTSVGWVCIFWSSLCVWPVSRFAQSKCAQLHWTGPVENFSGMVWLLNWRNIMHGHVHQWKIFKSGFQSEKYCAEEKFARAWNLLLSLCEIVPGLTSTLCLMCDIDASRCKQDWIATNFFPWTMSSHVRITICQCQKRRTISELEASYVLVQIICSSSASQFVATPASAHNSDHKELNFGFKEKRLWDLSFKLFVLLANRKMFYGHPFIQKKWNIQGWLVHLSSEWKDMLDKVEEEGGDKIFRGVSGELHNFKTLVTILVEH